ncbi:MAG: hypothetical protein M3552_20045 [Planctomycetota bacterium]|nr:hypothetical protein [Planctomycetaceae bacterium]MDQ3332909.1 hypothetical protein [Planctomycetota bacterium]
MPLSDRATQYLLRQAKIPSISDPSQVAALLRELGYPAYEPVISFQAKYGGLVLYSGLEPLQFGIVHLSSRSRWKPGTIAGSILDGRWYFECCNTLCQVAFEIDQDGRYLEDGDPIATSFDKYIEGSAVSDELWSLGWRSVDVPALAELSTPWLLDRIIERFGLSNITEASDEYSAWWISNRTALWKRGSDWMILENTNNLLDE